MKVQRMNWRHEEWETRHVTLNPGDIHVNNVGRTIIVNVWSDSEGEGEVVFAIENHEYRHSLGALRGMAPMFPKAVLDILTKKPMEVAAELRESVAKMQEEVQKVLGALTARVAIDVPEGHNLKLRHDSAGRIHMLVLASTRVR